MGKLSLIGRLVGRDLRHRPGPAVLLVLAITAATATLTLGLVLHGVTNQPYLQTRAATKGPDVVAQLGGQGRGASGSAAAVTARTEAQVRTLTGEPGVIGYSGPYPVASAAVRARGLTADVEVEGRAQAPASLDQPKVTAGTWVRAGRRRARAHVRRGAGGQRRRPGHAQRPGVPGGGDRGHRRGSAVPEPLLLPRWRLHLRPSRAVHSHRHRVRLGHRAGCPLARLGAGAAVLLPEPEAQGPGHGAGLRQRVRLRVPIRRS